MQPSLCRTGRHPINGPADRRSNGRCAKCSRDNEARYRARRLASADRLVAELAKRLDPNDDAAPAVLREVAHKLRAVLA